MPTEELKNKLDTQCRMLQARAGVLTELVDRHNEKNTIPDATQRLLRDLAKEFTLLVERYVAEKNTTKKKTPSNTALLAYHNEIWQELYVYQRETLHIMVELTELRQEVKKLKRRRRRKRNGSRAE